MKIQLKIIILSVIFLALAGTNFVLADENNSLTIPNSIRIKVNGSEYELSQSEIEQWTKRKSSLAYIPGYHSEIENTNFCQNKKSLECELTFDTKKQFCIKKVVQTSLDKDAIKKFLEDLSRQVNRDPEDAKLKMEDGKVSVFSLGNKGIKLDQEKSLEILSAFIRSTESFSGQTLELPYIETESDVSMDSIENMGITALIGEGRSNFKGSPKNRIFNINVAASRFNGVLIKPGEEFSFVKVLGEVDGEHGYKQELVIKKDRTEPEFGGGICQVSTTAFRAAINSGLKITARRNHAYPVSYYNPQGMDATVYVPRPDLRFINDTPGYILIQTKIEGTELIFDFYGTSDGRKTTIIGPKIVSREADGSMKTTFTQQVFNKDGDLILEDVFNSAYDSPNKYPHPGAITEKPDNWSKKQWEDYQKASAH